MSKSFKNTFKILNNFYENEQNSCSVHFCICDLVLCSPFVMNPSKWSEQSIRGITYDGQQILRHQTTYTIGGTPVQQNFIARKNGVEYKFSDKFPFGSVDKFPETLNPNLLNVYIQRFPLPKQRYPNDNKEFRF